MQKRYNREKESIESIKTDIDNFFLDLSIDQELFHDIKLSVIELVSNIIKYSQNNEEFSFQIDNKEDNIIIRLVYKDESFVRPVSKFKQNEMQESGLGVYLVSNLMDRLDYFYNEKKNEVEVRIEKRIRS